MPWNLVCDPWVSWSLDKTTDYNNHQVLNKMKYIFPFVNCLMIDVL